MATTRLALLAERFIMSFLEVIRLAENGEATHIGREEWDTRLYIWFNAHPYDAGRLELGQTNGLHIEDILAEDWEARSTSGYGYHC